MANELPSPLLAEGSSILDNMSLSEFLHISVRAESFEDEIQSNGKEPLSRNQDELLSEDHKQQGKPEAPLRKINLIFDTSAFLQGMGNVKRWFDASYATAQIKKNQGENAETVLLSCYIPSNTLHELNVLRRNSSIEGPNAIRALKFIDSVLDLGNGMAEYADDDSSNEKSGNLVTYDVEVEEHSAAYPSWKVAMRYAIHKNWPHEIDAGSKYLIRSCVSRAFISNGKESSWYVITENKARHCTNLFGFDCLNVNEAELLLFRAIDVTRAQPQAPGAGFNHQYDMYDNANIMTKMDSSRYGYSYIAGQNSAGVDENSRTRQPGSILEDFDSVAYAPRAKGKIWTPPRTGNKRRPRRKASKQL